MTRKISFTTHPVKLNLKLVKEDGSIASDNTLLTDDQGAALVSDFSRSCSVSISEPNLNGETQFLWNFICANGFTGKFEMPAPKTGFGILTVVSPKGVNIVYAFDSSCSLMP